MLEAFCRGVLLGGIVTSVLSVYESQISLLDTWYEVLLVVIVGIATAILLVRGAGWRVDKPC